MAEAVVEVSCLVNGWGGGDNQRSDDLIILLNKHFIFISESNFSIERLDEEVDAEQC